MPARQKAPPKGTRVVPLASSSQQVTHNLTPYNTPPPIVTNPGLYSYTRIHVCQASYGDCLVIEHDPTPPDPTQTGPPRLFKAESSKAQLKSPSRIVILIDGGPASITPSGILGWVSKPVANLYEMLEALLPPEGNMLDTLVVTHDDADHMNGIKQLLRSLNTGTDNWARGTLAISQNKAPFANIWHNSAQNVLKYRFPKAYEGKEAMGYFDTELLAMGDKVSDKSNLPDFNQEFGNGSKNQSKPTMLGTDMQTNRGALAFKFLGPLERQITELANFFKEKGPTKGGGNGTIDDFVAISEPIGEKWEHALQNLEKAPSNDTSKKNLSSLVFTVTGELPRDQIGPVVPFKALFMGDASAHTIFNDRQWDGSPIELDVMKVTHHGSFHNNFFGRSVVAKVKKQQDAFYPMSDKWKMMLPERLKNQSKEAMALTGVITYFANIRARKYIISASHDCHPNPHVSTLIGIIARAIMFPDEAKGPVEIYITNVIFTETWRQLIGFWLNVDHVNTPQPGGIQTEPELLINDWNDEQELSKLVAMAEGSKQPGLTVSPMSAAAMADLHFDYAGKFYKFMLLRPTRNWGTVHLRQRQLGEAWHWQEINPFSGYNRHYLGQHFQKEIIGDSILDTQACKIPTGSKVPKKGQKLKKQKRVDKPKAQKLQTSKKTTTRQKRPTKKQQAQEDARTLRRQPYGKDILHIEKKARKIKTRSMMMMMAMPTLNTNAMTTSVSPADSQLFMMAPVVVFSSQTTTSSPNLASIGQFEPSPLRLRWQNFRKFDVDLFEMPPGDFFGKETKLLYVESMDDFLYQLVLGDSMSLEDALLFDKNGFGQDLPLLGSFLSLLLGRDFADSVMRTLPLNSPTTWDAMQAGKGIANALLWELQDFDAVMLDVEALTSPLNGSSGIQQVSMTVAPPGGVPITWKMPNKANLLGDGTLTMTIPDGVTLTIYWPTDPKRRIVYGSFRGQVPAAKGGPHSVICEYMLFSDLARPIMYHIQFADQQFNTEGYEMSIADIMAVFGGLLVDITLAVADTVLPGFDSDNPFSDTIVLTEPGFVMSQDSIYGASLRLHRVFGTFSMRNTETWRPFSDDDAKLTGLESFLSNLEIPSPSVQLAVQDIFADGGPSLFFRLEHSFIFQEVDLAYEIQTRPNASGGKSYEFSFIPQNTQDNKPLSVMKLLETLTLNTLSHDDLPAPLHQILDAVSIYCFRVVWLGSSAGPHYIEIGLEVEQLDVVHDLLQIEAVMLRLRIEHPGDSKLRNIYLQAFGLLEVADVDLMVTLSYGTKSGDVPENSTSKDLDLEINCTNAPLTLGSILDHFFDETPILFSPFDTVVKEVGLTRFKFCAGSDVAGKYTVKLTHIELGVKSSTIEVLDGLALVYPTVAITALLPFDKAHRAFGVNFNAGVQINGYTLAVDIVLVFGTEQRYSISLHPASEDFPVSAFLEFCAQKLSGAFDIKLPTKFETLRTTYLDGFSISVAHKQQQTHIKSIEFAASSDLDLVLWDETPLPKVVLQRVALVVGYHRFENDTVKQAGTTQVSFEAQLDIGEHQFSTVVYYGKLSALNLVEDTKPGSSERKQALSSANDGSSEASKGWLVTATYVGEISLLEIATKLAGIDLKGDLSKSNTDKVKADDITIRNLNFRLQSDSSTKSICVSADTTWSIFRHIDFAAILANKAWGFCLSMTLGDDLLKLLPWDVAHEIGEYLKIDNTVVALYVGQVDPRKVGVKRKLPPRSSGSGSSKTQIGLAVATTLTLTEKFGVLNKWINKGKLDIFGEISNSGFRLAVKVDTLSMGNNPKTGQQTFEIQDASLYLELNRSQLNIGLQANMKVYLPDLTKSDILIQDAAIFLNTNTLGVGLKASIPGPLKDLFGVTGFNASGLSIELVFSIAEAGLPSVFGMSGAIELIGAGDVTGDITFYFAESNPFSSYIHGHIKNLSVVNLINFFLKNKGLPAAAEELLQGNVELQRLTFEMALDDVHDKNLNKDIKRGFFFEGLLHIKVQSTKWQGYALIEARPPIFQWIMMMSPIYFGDGGTTFFSLTRKEHEASDLIPDPVIQLPAGVDAKLMTDGPMVFISTEAKDTPIFISVKITLLGLHSHLRVVGNKNAFTTEFDASAGHGSLSCKVELVLHERVKVTGSLSLNLELLSIPQTLFEGLGKTVDLPGKELTGVSASLSLSMQVNWPGSNVEIDVSLVPTVGALGQSFNLTSISLHVNVAEIDSLEKIAQKVISNFGNSFKDLMVDFIGKLPIAEAAKFFRDQFALATTEMTNIISIIQNNPNTSQILQQIREALHLSLDEVARVLHDLDIKIDDAIRDGGEEFSRFLRPLLPDPLPPSIPIPGPFPFPNPINPNLGPSGPTTPIPGPIVPLPPILDILQPGRGGRIEPPFMGGGGGGSFPFGAIGMLSGADVATAAIAQNHAEGIAVAALVPATVAVQAGLEPSGVATPIPATFADVAQGVAMDLLPPSEPSAMLSSDVVETAQHSLLHPEAELPVLGLSAKITAPMLMNEASMGEETVLPQVQTFDQAAGVGSAVGVNQAENVSTSSATQNTAVGAVFISQEDSIRLLSALRKAGYSAQEIYGATVNLFNGSSSELIYNCMAGAGFGSMTLAALTESR